MRIEFELFTGELPYLTTAQMRDVEWAMIEDFWIELVQMIENAGRDLAHLACGRFPDGNPQDKNVVVLAGIGGNGGGSLVCARWLHNHGAQVRVSLPTQMRNSPRSRHTNWTSCAGWGSMFPKPAI